MILFFKERCTPSHRNLDRGLGQLYGGHSTLVSQLSYKGKNDKTNELMFHGVTIATVCPEYLSTIFTCCVSKQVENIC